MEIFKKMIVFILLPWEFLKELLRRIVGCHLFCLCGGHDDDDGGDDGDDVHCDSCAS